jgi:hypothetical protein
MALVAFYVLVAVLLFKLARRVDWAQAWTDLRALPPAALLTAAGLAVASHALYATYDLIGRHETGHGLSRRAVLAVGFTSYAFNLNLGALVGGVAFRYRLYARLGLRADVTTRVLALSVLTNWLGYVFVGGWVLLLRPPTLPLGWVAVDLRLLGAGLLLASGVYVALCFTARRREWTVRGHGLRLPRGHIALLQLALSAANWMLIAAVVHTLLRHQVPYATVLGVLLLAAVAGVIAHVPAGLGVLEAVFLVMLSQRLPQGELLAALLSYRVVYYLAPLALAAMHYLAFAGRWPGQRG